MDIIMKFWGSYIWDKAATCIQILVGGLEHF